jgi:hypothetical protein
MNDPQTQATGWKRRISREMFEYLANFVYLAFFFAAFAWYRRLILAARDVPISDYWVPVVEAAVLAKIIMILGVFRLGRRLDNKPLILPTLYKTLVFSVWIAIFGVLEYTVRGLVHGRGVAGGVEAVAGTGMYELLARCLVKFLALIPFFAYRELGRVVGEERLRALFWQNQTEFASGQSTTGGGRCEPSA